MKNLGHFRVCFQTKSGLYFHQRSYSSPIYILFLFNLAFVAFLFLFLAESLSLRFGPGFNFFASDIFFINTITEHVHNLYRMSSNLRPIAYDLHYCPGSKNYRRQNKMTKLNYTSQLSKSEWFTFFIYLIFTYIRNFQKTEDNDFGISYYFNL